MKSNLTGQVQEPTQERRRKQRSRAIRWTAVGVLVLLICFYPDIACNTIAIPVICAVGLFFFLLFLITITSPLWGGILLALAGVEYVQNRQAEKQAQDQFAQQPSQSLLRAGQAPTTLQEVLVRPALPAQEDDPQQLLRNVE